MWTCTYGKLVRVSQLETDTPSPVEEVVTLRKSEWDDYKKYVSAIETDLSTKSALLTAFQNAESDAEERKRKQAEAAVASKVAEAAKRKPFFLRIPWEVLAVLVLCAMFFVWNFYMLTQNVPLIPHGFLVLGVLIFSLISLIVVARGAFTKSVVPGAVMTLICIIATVVTQQMYFGKISAGPGEYVIQVTDKNGGLVPWELSILDENGEVQHQSQHNAFEAYYRVLPTEVGTRDTIVVTSNSTDGKCSIQLDNVKVVEAGYAAPGPLECRYIVPEPVPAG